MILRTIDIETTGLSPPVAEIIEVGRVDVTSVDGLWTVSRGHSRLYQPLRGIPPLTQAVHHITEYDIPAGSPVCTAERLHLAVWNGGRPTALVAHNASFEEAFIPKEITQDLPWICTLKVGMRLLPDAPGHSNQVLRYYLGLPLDPHQAAPPHRAQPDAYVTAHLLAYMLSLASVEEMVRWSIEPKCFPLVPLGIYRGKPWNAVDAGFLHWLCRTSGMDADIVWCAKREIEKRSAVDAGTASSTVYQGRFGNRKGGVLRGTMERFQV